MTPIRVYVADGIQLSVIKTDKFKSSLITFSVCLPLTKKNIAYNMLLTSTLKRGTQSYPGIAALNKRLDELYSSSLDIRSARIGKNLILTISADMLESRYVPDDTDIIGGILSLVDEIIHCPKLENGYFPESIVEQEKRFLADNINSIINNTRGYSISRLHELAYASDAEFPTTEELVDIVKHIDKATLTEFFRSIWTHSELRVFYVGDMPESELSERLRAHFSPWHTENVHIPVLPYPEPVCEYKSHSERMPVSQGKLAMGIKLGVCASVDGLEQYTATVLNEVFGASPASKLFLNVREKMGLCYFCSSSYDRYSGVMTISAGIENKNRQITENAITREFDDIRNGKISEFELSAAKKSILNGLEQLYDSPYDLQGFYGNRSFFGFSDNIETTKKMISAVTAEDISRLARGSVPDSLYFVEGIGAKEDSNE